MRRDIILIAGAPFGGRPPLGDWQMARALSAQHRVVYVDPPTFVHTALRRRDLTSLRPRLEQIDPDLFRLQTVAPPGANRPGLAAVGDRALSAQISHLVSAVTDDDRVVLTFDPKRGVLPRLPRAALVYWRRDLLSAFRGERFPTHVDRRTRELIAAADLVTGVSPELAAEARTLGADAVWIANGCDYEHFAGGARNRVPPGVPDAPVVIGFAGGVSPRVDLGLLCGIADARPEWQIVLVGEQTTSVPARPNLHLVGRQPYQHLPAWVAAFQVGLVPYTLDRFNRASFPLKVLEYLAVGRPVVSTPLPAIQGMAPHVRCASGVDGWVGAIQDALRSGPSVESCRALARHHDWANRAARLGQEIDRVTNAAAASA